MARVSLKEAQVELLKGLVELKEFCYKNNIEFWLDSGTLLGAVRHNGFIPWDDDIDISMMRKDYVRFIKMAKNQFSDEIFLQTVETDSYYRKWFIPCKIRVNKTLFVEYGDLLYGQINSKSHNGLNIDVFPMDYYGSKNSYILKKIIKGFKHYYSDKNKLVNIFYRLVGVRILNRIKNFLALRTSGDIIDYGIELPFKKRRFIESDIFPLQTIIFEGYEFKIPNNFHNYLVKLYGEDYMVLPPVEERFTHSVYIETFK